MPIFEPLPVIAVLGYSDGHSTLRWPLYVTVMAILRYGDGHSAVTVILNGVISVSNAFCVEGRFRNIAGKPRPASGETLRHRNIAPINHQTLFIFGQTLLDAKPIGGFLWAFVCYDLCFVVRHAILPPCHIAPLPIGCPQVVQWISC